MVEEQAQHRRRLEESVTNANTKLETRGQILGFVIAMTALIGGGYIMASGQSVWGPRLAALDPSLLASHDSFNSALVQNGPERVNKNETPLVRVLLAEPLAFDGILGSVAPNFVRNFRQCRANSSAPHCARRCGSRGGASEGGGSRIASHSSMPRTEQRALVATVAIPRSRQALHSVGFSTSSVRSKAPRKAECPYQASSGVISVGDIGQDPAESGRALIGTACHGSVWRGTKQVVRAAHKDSRKC